MANYLVTDTELSQIASAVRSKLGITNSFVYPAGIADAINSILNVKFIYDANYPSLSYVCNKFCTSIKSDAFNHCISLTSVSFPACTTIGSYAFYCCSSLTSVSFPACTTIGYAAFDKCENLSVIYLAKNSVVTLMSSKTGAFNYTGITSTTGSIRVPSNLVNSYKVATNWTYFSKRIFAI